MHINLYNADVTRLSFLIIVIFICTSIWIGNKTYIVGVLSDRGQRPDVGWFIAEACLALGMIGTVTGFLLMLNGAFAEIDLSNPTTIQTSLTKMALGMSTALYTTLTGLICSLALKIQLVNVENEYREF